MKNETTKLHITKKLPFGNGEPKHKLTIFMQDDLGTNCDLSFKCCSDLKDILLELIKIVDNKNDFLTDFKNENNVILGNLEITGFNIDTLKNINFKNL